MTNPFGNQHLGQMPGLDADADHAGGDGGSDAVDRILEHDAVGRGDLQLCGGGEVTGRVGLAALDVGGGHDDIEQTAQSQLTHNLVYLPAHSTGDKCRTYPCRLERLEE